ncbi:hypothetical protein M9194_20530 [Vibrio sp. S4M6]|uniref:hypothetical protein n=1 Tax=Vibrio sinus TaxID=2946865 RepID=UPI00202A5BDE|nr:hypothetical protein [Vibrio sinus]MCL9783816.1 hypothetical protein [Vibrio sinus]
MQINTNNHSFSQDTKTSEGQTSSDSDRQRAFSKMLHKKSKRTDSEPIPMAAMFMQDLAKQVNSEQSEEKSLTGSGSISALRNAGSVYQSKDIYIQRADLNTLNVRLLSGPLSGLEIQASLHAGKINMLLKSAQEKHRKYLLGQLDKLENKLNCISHYQVTIELGKADGQ